MREWEDMGFYDRLAVKQKSEKSFLNFTRIWFELLQGEKMSVNWHHKLVAKSIDDIIRGKVPPASLAINMPPGGTKTEFMSVHLPAYTNMMVQAGYLPRFRNMNLSYAKTLVERNSKRTKGIISSQEYQELWPCRFGTDKAEEWQILNTKGRVVGETVSQPMKGQITGGRGGYFGEEFSGAISLDDPEKPEDCFSTTKREASQRVMVNTVRSRRGDKSRSHPTPFFLIQQRLHANDLTDFCMNRGMGVHFDKIKIPALIDESYIEQLPEPFRTECWNAVKNASSTTRAGTKYWSYWPEWEDLDQLLELWDISEYTFMSQYMQEPITLGGNIFNGDWWKFYGEDQEFDEPMIFDYRFITGDTAQKTKTYNDFSVFCEWGVFQGRIYLINMVRGKWEAPELRGIFTSFIDRAWERNKQGRGNLRDIIIEDKSSGTGLIQEVGRSSPVIITPLQRNVDKTTRAMDTAPQIQQGKVVLPAGAPWLAEFISEHSAFTADDSHKNDDMVDNTMDAVDHAIIKGSFASDLFSKMRRRR